MTDTDTDAGTGTDVAARAAAGFRARYGADPAGLWAAPGRVNLIGEHTDYNDGYVLPFALPHVTVAAAALHDDGWVVASERGGGPVAFGIAEASEPGAVKGWAGYVAGVVWALREAGFAVPPAKLALASDVPVGAGLSSSAALESAVLTALVELGGLDLAIEKRPAVAQRAENVYAGIPCGIMDQSASIRCHDGHALFLDCRSLEVEHVPFTLDDLVVLVINSNAPHQLVESEYAARRASCEQAARALGVPALRDVAVDDLDTTLKQLDDEMIRRRVRHIVTENQRVLDTVALLRSGRVREIGPLMTASHASMRDDFEITVPEVDLAVETALRAGAYGARMTGGGFGGCVLALIDTAAVDAVAAAVTSAYAAEGFTAPDTFAATPAPGAHKLP
jgi:galactokinase